jgi:hypothetical protein
MIVKGMPRPALVGFFSRKCDRYKKNQAWSGYKGESLYLVSSLLEATAFRAFCLVRGGKV